MVPLCMRFSASVRRALWLDYRNSLRLIDEQQHRALLRLLRGAQQHVPFQWRRLRSVDFNHIELEQIPPTDKTRMMESFDETIAQCRVSLADVMRTELNGRHHQLPVVHGRYIVVKTSGSSGTPSWVVCDLRDWATLVGATFARMTRSLLTIRRLGMAFFRPIRSATIAAEHTHSVSWQSSQSAGLWAGMLGESRFFSVTDSLRKIAVGLDEFQPEHLHGYPTVVHSLAEYLLNSTPRKFKPKIITTSSETLTAGARATIQQAFPESRLVDHYGMSECLPLTMECQYGCKHVNTDYAIVEPRDANGRAISAGETSDHILITNLVNQVQPIIRYRIEDSVRMSGEPCQCGSAYPVIQLVSRKGSTIFLRTDRGDWKVLSSPTSVDMLLEVDGVLQYQVVHVRQNQLEIRFLTATNSDPMEVEARIRIQFLRVLEGLQCARSVGIQIIPCKTLERSGIGRKLHKILSLVEPPQGFEDHRLDGGASPAANLATCVHA